MLRSVRLQKASGVVLVALACGACSLGGGYAEFGVPVHVYEADETRPNYVPTAQTSSARYGGAEIGFVEDNRFDNPFDAIEIEDEFDRSRLYSSDSLTQMASARVQQDLLAIPRETRSVTAQMSLSAPSEQTGLAFDVDVTPRVTITRDGPFSVRSFGGEVRIGQSFDRRGSNDVIKSWYLFAGADGEAVVWVPGSSSDLESSDMALRDKVTVGDLQAGLSFQTGPGQISLSYIRREVEFRDTNLGASENEEFAGITYTIRR